MGLRPLPALGTTALCSGIPRVPGISVLRGAGSSTTPQGALPIAGTRAEPVPVPEVVVFTTPAPEGVGKTIDLLELLHSQATHPAEELVVGEPEGERRVSAGTAAPTAAFPRAAGDAEL